MVEFAFLAGRATRHAGGLSQVDEVGRNGVFVPL
jgi:hypothetical protein